MSSKSEKCSKCGEKSLIKGDLGLRTSRDLELIMVVRKDHGVEKKVPIQPKVCGKCGFVDLFVSNPSNLKIYSTDKPVDPDLKQRPILEYDF
jgi:ribosomal protein S27AE